MRTPISINVFSALSIAAITLAASPAANASIFISTGQSGAQVQCDEDHTQHWTYSVSQDVADISGASLTMKRGHSTTASISFAIHEGTYSQLGSANNLLLATLTPNSFTQNWSAIAFAATPISLLAGRTYTAVLYSDADDSQNKAYFIKGGGETPWSFVDSMGTPVLGGGQVQSPLPAPSVMALLVVAGFVARRRR